MKKILYALILLIVIGSCFWLYWKQLSAEEQWLFFNKKVASHYANELLADKHSKTPDELIDMHIVTESGMVIFDSNNQDRLFVVAYSPNGVPESIQSTKSNSKITWRKLQKDWYALNIKQ